MEGTWIGRGGRSCFERGVEETHESESGEFVERRLSARGWASEALVPAACGPRSGDRQEGGALGLACSRTQRLLPRSVFAGRRNRLNSTN